MFNIQNSDPNLNTQLKKNSQTRANPYRPKWLPQTVRKVDQFIKAGEYLFDLLARGNGNRVDLIRKHFISAGVGERWVRIWLHYLEQKHLITTTQGYFFNKDRWAYKKLMPTQTLSNALKSYQLKNVDPKGTGDAFIDQLNDLYAQHAWLGCAQPIVRRNGLDGRIYSSGSNHYQSRSAVERSTITVDGHDLVELDIAASHLTALIGLNSLISLEQDPYALPGLDRKSVKAAFRIMVGLTKDGAGRLPTSWHQDKDCSKGKVFYHGDIKKVVNALIKKYPFLRHLKQYTCYDLMKREADVMVRAIKQLMDQGVVSLSMHDGLLVESSAVDVAMNLIQTEFEKEFRIRPAVKVKEHDEDVPSQIKGPGHMTLDEIREWVCNKVNIDVNRPRETEPRKSSETENGFSSLHSSNDYCRPARAPIIVSSCQLEKINSVSPAASVSWGGKRSGSGRKKKDALVRPKRVLLGDFKPWVVLGVSRATYYRMKRKEGLSLKHDTGSSKGNNLQKMEIRTCSTRNRTP